MPAAVPVTVELLSLSAVGGRLLWRVESAPLDAAPDVVARRLAGVQDGAPAGTVLHSTSWRGSERGLVVTYALFPAPPAVHARPLELHLATGPGPLHPSPDALDSGHVAAHAVRHLADLAHDRDPHVVRCTAQRPAEWALLRATARQVHVDHDLAGVDRDRVVDLAAGVPGGAVALADVVPGGAVAGPERPAVALGA